MGFGFEVLVALIKEDRVCNVKSSFWGVIILLRSAAGVLVTVPPKVAEFRVSELLRMN